MSKSFSGIFIIMAVLLMAFVLDINNVQAITADDIIVSWRVKDVFAPSFYQGKVLPMPGSKVEISFDTLDAAGHRINVQPFSAIWKFNYNFLFDYEDSRTAEITIPNAVSRGVSVSLMMRSNDEAK